METVTTTGRLDMFNGTCGETAGEFQRLCDAFYGLWGIISTFSAKIMM